MHAILALAALGSGAWNAETLEWRATDWGKRGAERAWLVVKPYAASRRAGAREELLRGSLLHLLARVSAPQGAWERGEEGGDDV